MHPRPDAMQDRIWRDPKIARPMMSADACKCVTRAEFSVVTLAVECVRSADGAQATSPSVFFLCVLCARFWQVCRDVPVKRERAGRAKSTFIQTCLQTGIWTCILCVHLLDCTFGSSGAAGGLYVCSCTCPCTRLPMTLVRSCDADDFCFETDF